MTTFVENVPRAQGQRVKSGFFLLRDTPRAFLTRASDIAAFAVLVSRLDEVGPAKLALVCRCEVQMKWPQAQLWEQCFGAINNRAAEFPPRNHRISAS